MSLCSRLGQGVEKAKKAEQTQEWKSALDLRGAFKMVSLFADFFKPRKSRVLPSRST